MKLAITILILTLYTLFAGPFVAKAQTSSGSVLIPGKPVSGERAEVVSINGIPALRFVSRDGYTSLLYFQKHNGENAFAVPVWHIEGIKYDRGWLYVARNHIAYVPDKEKSDGFDEPRTEVKKAKSVSTGMWNVRNRGNYFEIDLRGGSRNFWIYFEGAPQVANRLGLGGSFQKPILTFLDKAIADFDKAAKEFQQLTTGLDTASAPPNFGVSAGPLTINEKYDRFRDSTTISTSTMVLRNVPDENYSLGIAVSFSYQGSKPMRPESITLRFHLNSLRQMFLNEEDREVTLLIDGKRLKAGILRLDSEDTASTNAPSPNLKNTVYKTTWSLAIPAEAAEEIIKAEKVEMQIGNIEASLTRQQQDALNQLMSRSKGQ
ncbi:MAG: hypothetical protein QOD75_815 [Blastocatellia bacterium]|jgi:hypothetical protein|nr:hypothetical protein [Blastocatellia bacterium]